MANLDIFTNAGLDPDAFLFRVIENGGYDQWSSTEIVLRETTFGDEVVVTGHDFVWDSFGRVVGGTVDGWELVLGGSGTVVGTVTAFDADANDFFAAVEDVWNGPGTGPLDDIVYGSEPFDAIGGGGGDVLLGSDFSDTLTGGAGRDTLSGRFGIDLVDYSAERGRFAVAVDLASRTATDTYGNTDRLLSIEDIIGTRGNDDLRGTDGRNAISGGSGNDLIYGRGGADGLYGSFGHDTIYGGSGNDRLEGDAGIDRLYGDNGRDAIFGGIGSDALFGGAHDDTLSGGTGNDRISGGTGNDQIWGGAGNDTLFGGSGADLFRFSDGFWSDTIADFRWTEGDKVDLRSVTGVDSYADIGKFVNAHGDAVAVIGDDQITFQNLAWGDLRSSDFLIA